MRIKILLYGIDLANATGGSTGNSPIDETMTEEQIQAKITEFKTNHPKFARCS